MDTPLISAISGDLGVTMLAVCPHPDDESSATGGMLAYYHARGVRTGVVICTGGEEGEIHDPALDQVADRPRLRDIREREVRDACAILGVAALQMLGYRDSGMPGVPANQHPEAFSQADPGEAAGRLVQIIRAPHAITEPPQLAHPLHIMPLVGVDGPRGRGSSDVPEADRRGRSQTRAVAIDDGRDAPCPSFGQGFPPCLGSRSLASCAPGPEHTVAPMSDRTVKSSRRPCWPIARRSDATASEAPAQTCTAAPLREPTDARIPRARRRAGSVRWAGRAAAKTRAFPSPNWRGNCGTQY